MVMKWINGKIYAKMSFGYDVGRGFIKVRVCLMIKEATFITRLKWVREYWNYQIWVLESILDIWIHSRLKSETGSMLTVVASLKWIWKNVL